jgi:hypothetical protein
MLVSVFGCFVRSDRIVRSVFGSRGLLHTTAYFLQFILRYSLEKPQTKLRLWVFLTQAGARARIMVLKAPRL